MSASIDVTDELLAEYASDLSDDEDRTVIRAIATECLRQRQRNAELRQIIVSLTHSTPFLEEAEECCRQRAALLAEVGTLRAENVELCREKQAANHELERWRHGRMIEGDYVCPYEFQFTALMTLITDMNVDLKVSKK